ncbi:MAG TPA: radical SAM protein [Candidatus Omnitrophota bacterium]|nr:B12-binding domain-containing radical SAM protein [Candidatus Omnitrophota bacterium]HQO58532.1 radical SAM protein [Candidatus Omnitrophota bacterium]HQP11436.1 radical SAM protein [Candidatus Omnitrophota bacterium]
MKLSLIFNPFSYKAHEENLKIVQKYFGLFPPLSLAWVAAIAEQSGHQVQLIDARTLKLSQEETFQQVQAFKPDIMGFMMTTYMFQDTLSWIKFLKARISVPVVVGGYNLRVYPRESLSHPEIDFGVVEHAYYTIPRLLEELESGRHDFATVPGLVYKKNGLVLVTPHPQKINFNDFPNPARHLLPNHLYAEFPTERRNFTVMVTSLGCPYGCAFCEAGRTPYNPRSPEKVVAEMEECYLHYGIREIDIFDYEFTGIRDRVMKICQLIKEKNWDMIWACRSRIDTVDVELLSEMKQAGCRRIYFGLESGRQDILDRVQKGYSLKQVQDMIAACSSLGIRTLGFFLVGAPGDTRETVKETVAFAKKLNLDYVQFSKCLAKPLTPLWKDMVAQEQKDYWRDWVLGTETDRELPRPWTELTNQEVDQLARWAYISYYARPSFLWKHLLKIGSFLELKRKVLALIDMLWKQEPYSRPEKDFKAFNENPAARVRNYQTAPKHTAPPR